MTDISLFSDSAVNRGGGPPKRDVPGPSGRIDATIQVKDVSSAKDGTRFTAIASTGSVDRDGESIDPDGWVFPKTTLPLFFGHAGYRDANNWIGVIERASVVNDQLLVDGFMPDTAENAIGRKISGFMKAGIQVPGSVGFDPFEWVERDGHKGARDRGGPFPGASLGRRYTKQELLEYSIVPVPSNVDAISTGLKMLAAVAGRDSFGDAVNSLADALSRQKGAPLSHDEETLEKAMERVLAEYDALVHRYAKQGVSPPYPRLYSDLDLAWIRDFGHPLFPGRQTEGSASH
jgi:hypothetical protein